MTTPGPSLAAHLRSLLGSWPPELPLDVVGSEARGRPGGDGVAHRLLGVLDPDPAELGEPGLVLSVPPGVVEAIELLGGLDPSVLERPSWRGAVVQALGTPSADLAVDVLRWLDREDEVADLDDAGAWVPRDDPAVPPWVHHGDAQEVLLARDAEGRCLGAVDVAVHDAHGAQLTLGVEAAARGRVLAPRLLATAARRVLAGGRVATYRHAAGDAAAAEVAAAAGFGDRGWRLVRLVGPLGGQRPAPPQL